MAQETRQRLLRRLQWQKAINHPVAEPRNQLANLSALRRWQANRLAAGFADFLTDPIQRPAAEFFLSDLYGDRDFSARDRDAAKILPVMSRLLPESLLCAATDAIELAVLSHAFDLRMAEALLQRPEPSADIRVEDYARYFHSVVGNRIVELTIEGVEPVDCEVVIPINIIPRAPEEAVTQALEQFRQFKQQSSAEVQEVKGV